MIFSSPFSLLFLEFHFDSMLEFLDLSEFPTCPFTLWFGRISSPFSSVLNAVLLESGLEEQISLFLDSRLSIKTVLFWASCPLYLPQRIILATIFQKHLHNTFFKNFAPNDLKTNRRIATWNYDQCIYASQLHVCIIVFLK